MLTLGYNGYSWSNTFVDHQALPPRQKLLIIDFPKTSVSVLALILQSEAMADAEISKNAAKKAAKAAEAAAKKAEKDAAKAAAEAAAPKKEKLGEEVEELDPTKYYENRLTQLKGFEVRSKRSFVPGPPSHDLHFT